MRENDDSFIVASSFIMENGPLNDQSVASKMIARPSTELDKVYPHQKH